MSDSEFAARRCRVATGLAEHKADALLVSCLPNVRYLTGFTGSNALLLVTVEATLFTDPRYAIQSAHETNCHIQVCKGTLLEAAAAFIRKKRMRRVAFEQAHLSFQSYRFLMEHLPPAAHLEPVSGWIEQLRAIKSPTEIERIRQAVQTNSRAFEQGIRRVRAGMRESELAAELDYRMRRLGAEGPAFETIVAAGARSALPHARPTEAALAHKDLVVVDMGCTQSGYTSDMTRMLYLGRPSSRVKQLYRAVLEAQLAAIAAVRGGVTAAQVDREARRLLRAEKLDRAFVHSTGHGLGLEIHEPPRLGQREKTRLRPGMVVTIEPGVYLEGVGGIRIEDTVAVTANGCEVLTPTSKELRVI